jgi:hypothetical protein
MAKLPFASGQPLDEVPHGAPKWVSPTARAAHLDQVRVDFRRATLARRYPLHDKGPITDRIVGDGQ